MDCEGGKNVHSFLILLRQVTEELVLYIFFVAKTRYVC